MVDATYLNEFISIFQILGLVGLLALRKIVQNELSIIWSSTNWVTTGNISQQKNKTMVPTNALFTLDVCVCVCINVTVKLTLTQRMGSVRLCLRFHWHNVKLEGDVDADANANVVWTQLKALRLFRQSCSLLTLVGISCKKKHYEKWWNEAWPYSIQSDPLEMFCFRHTFSLWPYMVSCGALQWNI